MAKPFDAVWWSGEQALAWILFRDPELVSALVQSLYGNHSPSRTLLETIRDNKEKLLPAYRQKTPLVSALNELQDEMRAGRVRWRHSARNVKGTTAEIARRDLACDAKRGVIAIFPGALPLVALYFRRQQIVGVWKPINVQSTALAARHGSGTIRNSEAARKRKALIKEAALKLFARNRTPANCGSWSKFHRELLSELKVVPGTRGYGPDTIEPLIRRLLDARGEESPN